MDQDVVSSSKCACIGKCMGFECVKRRATALVSSAATEEARLLLEEAFENEQLDTAMRNELQGIYHAAVSAACRPRPRASMSDGDAGGEGAHDEHSNGAYRATNTNRGVRSDGNDHSGDRVGENVGAASRLFTPSPAGTRLQEEEKTIPSSRCACVGKCVGFECLKQRSTALMSAGSTDAARRLLEAAMENDDLSEALRDQLQTIYLVTVTGSRRPRPTEMSDGESDGAHGGDGSGDGSVPAGKRRHVDAGQVGARGQRLERLLDSLNDHFACVICSKLLFEPVTTPCGHTFCCSCLSRAMDVAGSCPMCRTVLHMEDPTALPVSNTLRDVIQTVFGTEYETRRKEMLADAPTAENAMSRLPLFPLNAVVFPMQRFPMHIFEPRYRLMLRRIMQGSRRFGLIALKRTQEGGSELCEVGCVLEVTKAERFPDGRSLIETVARERFRVHGRTMVDGYLVGRTEVYVDNEETDTDEVRDVERKVRATVESLMEHGSKLPTMKHALQRAGDVPDEAAGASALGMWLAGMLVSDDNERQNMLEMQNSGTRLREVVVILERLVTSTTNNSEGRECCLQ